MRAPIRVGFDAHMIGSRETGNETYALGLIDGFRSMQHELDLFVYHVNKVAIKGSHHVHPERLLSASPWTRLTFDLPLRAWRDKADLLHTTYAAPLWTSCPTVVTVHDISFASHPQWFSSRDLRVLSAAVPWSIHRASRVVTVSQFCRREILERYRLPDEKVVCIYNAPGPAGQPLSEEERRAELKRLGIDVSRPYVLAVGNVQPRKNLVRLIQAFALVSDRWDCQLVIVGPEHFRAELTQAAAMKFASKVHFTGYVTHRQLAACYAGARVFAFPSLFEGFGIPALEAMAHGTPVVSANAGALPEVCAGAALYFDPLDVDSMAGALEQVLGDPALRAELSRLGLARQRAFTWVKAARETLDVYQTVVSPGRC